MNDDIDGKDNETADGDNGSNDEVVDEPGKPVGEVREPHHPHAFSDFGLFFSHDSLEHPSDRHDVH